MEASRKSYQEILFSITQLSEETINPNNLQNNIDNISDWGQFFKQLELDGLAPIFHKHSQSLCIILPKSAEITLKSLVFRHKAIAQARYQALSELDAEMQQANIPWLALKGLALAITLYDNESLRPMRDFDILVPLNRIKDVEQILRKLSYDLPEEQPSKFMRYTHQLPNAEKVIDGFRISIEVHHNALGQDAHDSITYADVVETVAFNWRETAIKTLPPTLMLHQLARHLEALHPGGRLKLVNVIDVAAYAELYFDQIDWQLVKTKYPHILTTLECLSLLSPLGKKLDSMIGRSDDTSVSGVGEIMMPLTSILSSKNALSNKLRQLFTPSSWWLHLYYGVSPSNSLLFVKLFRHPFTLLKWAAYRAMSLSKGG